MAKTKNVKGKIVRMDHNWFNVELENGEIIETQFMSVDGFKKGQHVKGVICTGAVTKQEILCGVLPARRSKLKK